METSNITPSEFRFRTPSTRLLTTTVHRENQSKVDNLYRGSKRSTRGNRSSGNDHYYNTPLVHWTHEWLPYSGTLTWNLKVLARYQIILLGEQRHIGVNNLPKVLPDNAAAGSRATAAIIAAEYYYWSPTWQTDYRIHQIAYQNSKMFRDHKPDPGLSSSVCEQVCQFNQLELKWQLKICLLWFTAWILLMTRACAHRCKLEPVTLEPVTILLVRL